MSEREAYPDICVVTQPLGDSDPTATNDLLAILSAITSVSLVTIALADDSELREEYDVVEISEREMGSTPLVAAIRFLRNQIRMCFAIYRRDEEVILFFGAMAYVLPIAFARLIGKTVVVEPRADVPLSLKLQWERQLPDFVAAGLAGLVRVLERTGYRLADAIIAYTPGMAEQLNLYTYEEKLFTNGARFVDTETFDIRVPFEERPKRVGYIGRFAEEKGIRTLAAVAKELPDDVTFRFVGDGPLREWMEAELAAEIKQGNVEIRGWVDHEEVPSELNKLRLLVMPSEPTEGLPTLILEAMACGTPVYASSVAGIPDVVIPNRTGFLFESDDSVAIKRRVVSILCESVLDEYSPRCRSFTHEHYRFSAAVNRYEEILSTLLGVTGE